MRIQVIEHRTTFFSAPGPSSRQEAIQVDTLELAISRSMVGDDNPEMYIFENLNGTGFRCKPDDESCRYGVVWNRTRTDLEHLAGIHFAEHKEKILQYFFLFANSNDSKGNAYQLYSYIGNFIPFVFTTNCINIVSKICEQFTS